MPTSLQIDNPMTEQAQPVKDEAGRASSLHLSNNRLGIGTQNPQGTLDVAGNLVFNGNPNTQLSTNGDSIKLKGNGSIVLDLSPIGGGQLHIACNRDDNKIYLEGFSSDGNGHAAELLITGRYTQPLPQFTVNAKAAKISGSPLIFDLSGNGGGQLLIGNNLNDNRIYLEGIGSDGHSTAAEILITGAFPNNVPRFSVLADTSSFNGDVEVSGDIRLLNADCAEDFDICDSDIEAGTVMVLGDDGALHPSSQAYDKRVAGVVSGAGDYRPGIVLDKQPTGKPRKPIALMGKVYCKVDAEFGEIAVGDLLTTSPTPGHAMKAGDALSAFGAVIGKALRPLKGGKGLVPVLIALQ
jgi:hypothetical protein